MSEVEDATSEVDRRAAAGRVATWFAGEIVELLQTLRRTVAEAPVESARRADQDAAARILVAARACSARVSTVLGLRAEPKLAVEASLARELEAVLAELPESQRSAAALLDSIQFPLSAAATRSMLRHLLDNAREASTTLARIEATGRGREGGPELWVTSQSSLSAADASRAACPFFSTKAGHTGLGLSLVHVAVENQGGRLEILPSEGETRIGVTFPEPGRTAKTGAGSDVSFACHLAAGLAHDVNNALMAALGWAEILDDARDDAEREEAIATLSQAADYLEAMSYLLPYDGALPRPAAAIDLGQAFERMRPLLRAVLEHKADRKIALHVRSVQGARIAMSEDALRSLVLRLAENAREAMPKGGTWTIACDVQPRDLLLTLSAEVRGTDLGASSPHASSRAHNPKQGLGLAVARDLVLAAGGAFEDDLETPTPPSIRIRLPGSPS